MKSIVVSVASLLAFLALTSCATKSPTAPIDDSLTLTTFDLKTGDKLLHLKKESSVEKIDTLNVTYVTGVSGSQVVTFDNLSAYQMRNRFIDLASNSGYVTIAKFPSVRGDTVARSLDSLVISGEVKQIYRAVLVSTTPDTTVTTAAGTFRCGVFTRVSLPTIVDGTAPIAQISTYVISTRYGMVTLSVDSWAGASTDGSPFEQQQTELIKIIRK